MEASLKPAKLIAMLPRSILENTHSRGLHFNQIISKTPSVWRGFKLNLIIFS